MYQFVSPSLETELLSHIVHNQAFLEKCIECLSVDKFGSKVLNMIYYEIIEFYKKWGKIPDKNSIRQTFRDTLQEEDYLNIKEFIIKIWDATYPSIPEAVLSEVIGKHKARKLAIAVQRIGELLKEGKTNECDALLANYQAIISGISSEDHFKETEITESLDGVLAEIRNDRDHPKEFKGCPTFIIGIDSVIKGLLPSELGLVLGKTGGYKSTMLINFAANAFISGRKVLFFTIESSPRQYMLNIYSLLFGIDAEKLHELNFNDKELELIKRKMKNIAELHGGKIIFIDAPQGLTCQILQLKIKEAKRKYGHIDICIIDYLGIMELKGTTDYYDWKTISTLSRLVKMIARAENIAIWSAAQQIGDKKNIKEDNEEHSVSDIAFAKSISHNCDLIIKAVDSDQERLMHQLRLYFLKIRRKGKPISPVIFETKMEWMRIDNPSTTKLMENLYKEKK